MQSNQAREVINSRHLHLKSLILSQVQAYLKGQSLSFLSLLQKSKDLKYFQFFQFFHLFLILLILFISEILKFVHVIHQEFANKELSSFIEPYLMSIFVDHYLLKKGEIAFLYLIECQRFHPKFYLYYNDDLMQQYFHGNFNHQQQIISFKFKFIVCFTSDLFQLQELTTFC